MHLNETVWRHHDLRALAAGQTLSWIGDGFSPIALATGVVLAGGGAGDLGIPLAAIVTGRLLCVVLGGVWGDRLQPVRVMAVSDLVRAGVVAGLAYLFATDSWTVTSLAVLMGLSGAAGAFFHPAFSALKPRVVPDGEQQAANAGLAMLETGTRLAGPLLGGLVVAVLGPAVGFGINAATFLVSAVLVLRVRVRPQRAPAAPFLHDLREGFGAVASRPWLASGIVAATVYHLGNGVLMVLLPLIVVRDLGGSGAYGMVQATIALGSLVGGLLAARIHPHRPIAAGFGLLVFTAVGFLGLAHPAPLPMLALGLAVGFGALMIFGVWWETTIQQQVPGHQLGRVNAWDQLGSFAVLPVGNLLAGPLTDAYGNGPVVLGCVGLLLLASLAPLLVRDTWAVRMTHGSTPARELAGKVD